MKCASLFAICASLHAAVHFEPNRGQAPVGAPFVARAGRTSAALRANELVYRGRTIVTFEGGRAAARAAGEQLLHGVSHYARGNDPARWVWDVAHYARVRFAGVYPGIDVVYRGAGDRIEFDFELAPGAVVSRIRMRPAPGAQITETGALQIAGATFAKPAAWQTVAGKRVPVDVAFTNLPGGRIGLRTGPYDRGLPLTIDPIIDFATYLGGSDDEADTQVLGGSDGAVYVAGTTVSADFPAALPDSDLLNRPVTLFEPDVYVTRLKSDASAMDWSIFIGGTAADSAMALRADQLGNIYIFGRTSSANLPVTAGAWHTTIAQTLTDTFIAKLDAVTGHIKACTYLGLAVRSDINPLVTVDAAGGVYLVNDIAGSGTTATPGAYQSKPGPIYIIRLNSGLTAQVYGTFFNLGRPVAIDVDSGGNLWLGGNWQDQSTPAFPALNPIAGISQTQFGAAMIVRLNAPGSALNFASLLHGGGNSSIFDLKVTPAGELWVVGASGAALPQVNPVALDPLPANYPATPDPAWPSPFLVRISPSSSTLLQSTFFYGPEFTPPGGSVTPGNKHIILGGTGSVCITNLPLRLTQIAGGLIAASDSFTPNGGTLYCLDDAARKFIVKTGIPPAMTYTSISGTADGAVLFGGTAAPGFATTAGTVQPNFGGGVFRDRFNLFPSSSTDSLLLRISLKNPSPAIARVTPDTFLLDAGTSGTMGFQVSGSGFAYAMDATVNGTPATFSMSSTTQANVSTQFDTLRAGSNTITLGLPPPGGGTSQIAFNAINVTPSQISVSPSSVTQGAGETKVVIFGSNLSSQSTLQWNGQPRDAKFVLDQARLGHFELLLEPPELAQAQVAQITFTNPPPGGGTSPVAVFTVQPASGPQIPRLNTPGLLVIGAPATAGSRLALTGINFTAGMRAFWDGAEVPVQVTSPTAISISPPAADLQRMGRHAVYVSLNGLISATVPVVLVSSLATGSGVVDTARQRLYMSGGGTGFGSNSPDLLIFDMRQGDLIDTLTGAVTGFGFFALSDDGQYLYMGSNDTSGTSGPKSTIRRFNTNTRTIDLNWNLPAFLWGIATVPGSNETAMVATSDQAITIYDRDQPRPGVFQNVYQSTTTMPFVTANRLFLTAIPQCWTWVDFDATGFLASRQCGPEPPEARHDSGVVYLTDGTRQYPVSTPLLQVNPFVPAPILAMDLKSRRVAQLATNGFARTLSIYNLDTQQQQMLFTIPGATGSGGLWFNQDGNFLVHASPYLTFVK